jgi:hypothetical protein
LQASALRKVRWRLIPFLFLLYIVAYLDRVNVGFASLDMNRDLAFRLPFMSGVGTLFPDLHAVRSPEQPGAGASRRTGLDRAHHADVGRDLDGDDLRRQPDPLLHGAAAARRRRSRIFPGTDPVFDALVSRT